jgi:hypothetical protein
MGEPLTSSELIGYRSEMTSSFEQINDANSPVTRDPVSSGRFISLGVNQRIGSQNPAFRDQIKAGINATTLFSGIKFDGDLSRSFWSFADNFNVLDPNGNPFTRGSVVEGAFIPYIQQPQLIVVDPDIKAEVHNRLISKFLQAVSDAQSSDNLTGRSIKHFKHDMHSLIHPMQGIQDKISSYLTSLKKVSYGKLKGPSLLSTIGSAYLEFKFGVEPFTDDVTAIMTDLVIKDRRRPPSVPISVSASKTFDVTDLQEQYLEGYASIYSPTMKVRIESSYSERIKGSVWSRAGSDGKLGLIQDNKLLPKDWLPTAFSIMPYAWMVNYFTNIGEMIDAACFNTNDLAWGCLNTKIVNTVRYSDVQCTPYWSNIFSPLGYFVTETPFSSGGNAMFSCTQVGRSALSSSDLVPSFQFQIPKTPTPYLNMMAAFLPRITNIVSRLFT